MSFQFKPDLTAKLMTGLLLTAGNLLATFTRIDKFKPYLYPGPIKIYKDKGIDVDKFREGVVAFIQALLKQHRRGNNVYETLDNLIGPIETNEDLKRQYEVIVATAKSIRKAKFEYEEETGENFDIK